MKAFGRLGWERSLAIGLLVAAIGTACGGGGGAAPALKPAEPAKPAEAKPAAPAAQPPAASQPAPAASQPAPAKPASEPAKPEAAKPAKPEAAKPAGPVLQALVGTTQSTSGHYTYFVGVSKVVNSKVPEVNMTVVETGASVENTNRMIKGEFPFALINPDVAYRAYEGLEQWKDKAFKEIRTMWIYAASPTAYAVRADSNVKSVTDLNGKDFNPGMRGSATESQTRKAMEVLGVTPKYFVGGTEDAVAAIKDRRIAGMAKTFVGLSADAVILDLQVATTIRILPFTKEQIAKIEQAAPWYGHMDIPANTFPKMDENKEPILTLALVQGTHTTTQFSDDLTYKIVKALFEDNKLKDQGIQGGAMPAVKDLDFEKTTIEQAKVPLHKGALKYFREIGTKVPDALVPPEAK
ncbi:MAG: TAXI family TRAP transporter solute-binding subunit [Chloroflexi bacterium]|nr:TAXI family TRAP transporter solute-binding subunit [Chloroflexota bacterium]